MALVYRESYCLLKVDERAVEWHATIAALCYTFWLIFLVTGLNNGIFELLAIILMVGENLFVFDSI